MKRLFLVLGLVTVLLASCCNNNQKGAQKCDGKAEQKCEQKCDGKHDHKCDGKHDHDCKMNPEAKATFEKWNNWANLTVEEQTELVAQVKSCIDKCDAEMKAKCEARKAKCEARKAECEAKKAECDKKVECEAKKAECEKKKAECEAKRTEFEAEWANFDNLTLEGKKSLIDKKMQFCKERPHMKGNCEKHEHPKCDKAKAECGKVKAECKGHQHQHEGCDHQH